MRLEALAKPFHSRAVSLRRPVGSLQHLARLAIGQHFRAFDWVQSLARQLSGVGLQRTQEERSTLELSQPAVAFTAERKSLLAGKLAPTTAAMVVGTPA